MHAHPCDSSAGYGASESGYLTLVRIFLFILDIDIMNSVSTLLTTSSSSTTITTSTSNYLGGTRSSLQIVSCLLAVAVGLYRTARTKVPSVLKPGRPTFAQGAKLLAARAKLMGPPDMLTCLLGP